MQVAVRNQTKAAARSLSGDQRRVEAFPGFSLDAGPDDVLRKNADVFRTAFEFANIGFGLADLRGKLLAVNPELSRILGFSAAELKGINLKDLEFAGDGAATQDILKTSLEGSRATSVSERRLIHKQGRALDAEVSCGLARSKAGTPLFIVATFRDITERKRLEALLEEQASIDPLTRALNRARLEERASQELMRSDRHGHKLSLVLVDLDHFKRVNDTFGHAAGDQVLKGFGEIARGCLRLTDLLGRWGGEEFALLLPDTGPGSAGVVAERLRASLEQFAFPGGIRVTASMGVVGCRPGEDFAALMGRADAAMYRAKQTGRNRVVVDAQDMTWEAAGNQEKTRFLELQWKAAYTSGLAGIDSEHRRIFHVANLLMAAMLPAGSSGQLQPLVQRLVAEVETHFAHEEELLARSRYPGLAMHRERHAEMLARVRELAGRFLHGECSAGDLLGFLIHDVVARHILQEDRAYFQWLKENAPGAGRKRRPNTRHATA
jgi:diguanylate cyclase (GGDEF)-like protein/hemerythrin-like metal-binding protein/PAS domain S-box-containing protein